jgi:hypothetical protein
MKKVFSIWSWVMLLTLCVGLSSCSDDDEESGGKTLCLLENGEQVTKIREEIK